jgi:hypothetical protein
MKARRSVVVLNDAPYGLGVRQQIHLKRLAAAARAFHDRGPVVAVFADDVENAVLQAIGRVFDMPGSIVGRPASYSFKEAR